MAADRIEEARQYLEELAADIELMNEEPREVMEFMVALGKKAPELPAGERTEERLVPGCTSSVWVAAALEEGERIRFRIHAEAFIVKGYVHILLEAFDHWPAEAFLGERSDELLTRFLERTRLGVGTLASRTNSVRSIYLKMKERAALAAEEQGSA